MSLKASSVTGLPACSWTSSTVSHCTDLQQKVVHMQAHVQAYHIDV